MAITTTAIQHTEVNERNEYDDGRRNGKVKTEQRKGEIYLFFFFFCLFQNNKI